MIMLMSPTIADHLYRGYFEGIVNYIGQEVFGTMRVFMGYDANPPESVSAEQSEPTPGIVELARECDGPRGPHEPDLLPVSSLIALIALES